MKNRLVDLNNHLFSQLERLTDEAMTAEQIEQEVKRSDAIVAVSEQIIRNADLSLKAVSLVATHGDRFAQALPMMTAPAPAEEGGQVRSNRPLIKAAGT
ncbi:hypothetical protein NGM99_13970 [Mesorhizobium sp. RP14(2022)]|uniref:Uncharacterized protein n=1 Tax=Mesorhizobium liriopis TaxID=2953882 RepID=A0ABT1C7Y6_9HYPH|nr:hypothetical protein [Mesorhizobium liriopis]MCO6050887.1 hypothetical protein [Mesorhizobium liriopis]